jgi:actin-related protein
VSEAIHAANNLKAELKIVGDKFWKHSVKTTWRRTNTAWRGKNVMQ